jgi:phage gpG-like protein
MPAGLTVDGADRFVRTLRAAGRELEDLTATNQAVAAGVAQVANPPRLTGRLAASITPTASRTTATVTAAVPYAVFVEARTGFLGAAMTARAGASLDLYADALDGALANVAGV